MSHWRAREPALTNAHTREYPLHGAPVSASRLPVCLLHRILLHARERVRNARRSLIARVRACARHTRKEGPTECAQLVECCTWPTDQHRRDCCVK